MTSDAQPVWRVGAIGAGEVARRYHLPILRAMGHVEVAWVCDLDLARARSVARTLGIPAAHSDLADCAPIDVALLAIPVGGRRAVLEAVLARGWHAFVEKPFALTRAEHGALVEAASARGLHLGVGLMRRFHRAVVAAERIVTSGVLGPIRAVWASEVSQLKRTGRGRDWYQADAERAGGGVLVETGSHLLDTVAQILGVERFEGVRAALSVHGGVDLEAHVLAVAATEQHGAVRVAFRLSRMRELFAGVVVEGEHACVHVPIAAEENLAWLDRQGRRIAGLEVAVQGARNAFQAFHLEWSAFLEQCATGLPGRADARSNAVAIGLIETAYEVARRRELT